MIKSKKQIESENAEKPAIYLMIKKTAAKKATGKKGPAAKKAKTIPTDIDL